MDVSKAYVPAHNMMAAEPSPNKAGPSYTAFRKSSMVSMIMLQLEVGDESLG
jgi:hypothetical protein